MDFLDLLSNLVLRNHLLPLLEVNDLLRLRRVCQSFHDWIDDFIRIEKVKTSREIKTDFYRQIKTNDEDDKPSREQLNIVQPNLNGFSTPLIFRNVYFSELDTKNIFVLYSAPVQTFMEICGINITHLTFHTLGLPVYSETMVAFLESFTNVTHLVVQDIKSWREWTQEIDFVPAAEHQVKIPSNLRNLKSLCIQNGSVFGEDSSTHQDVIDYITKLVETCLLNLEKLSLPFREFWDQVERRKHIHLGCICLYRAPKLRFLNADGWWIHSLLNPNHRTPEMGSLEVMLSCLKDKVMSICNPMQMQFLETFPNLEGVQFTHMSRWTIPDQGFINRRNWPKLKKIKVQIDLEYLHRRHACGKLIVRLWSFLFTGVQREHVVKLDISLKDFADEFERYPGTAEIVASCPNLKILKIKYWCHQHGALLDLWRGLPALEHLHLDHCIGLDNHAFVGEDAENPTFLDLKYLKVLELGSMEEMLVTDEIFNKVLCHMSLKKLSISSTGQVQSVTLNGIRSLLNGKFASTIEKLCLKDLQLSNVSNEEKNSVECEFRSSRMI